VPVARGEGEFAGRADQSQDDVALDVAAASGNGRVACTLKSPWAASQAAAGMENWPSGGCFLTLPSAA